MNLERANLAIKVAIDKANQVGGKYCIAVLDAGVNLVAFNRMDGGRVGTIDVAMKKVTWYHLHGNISLKVSTLPRPEPLLCLKKRLELLDP